MAITVRRATAEDLDRLRAKEPRPGLVDQHFALQGEGTIVYAVALDDETPVGTAVLDLDADRMTPELRNMFVYPDARRKGAGRALTRFIEDEARTAGHTAVYLAVDPNNYKAVPLYISLEYHPTGEHLFVDNPEVPQVEEGQQASTHYAIYKKSLTAR
ncbi:MAG: GNAT family N-acetyltransferase [Arachnia sp.]